MQYDRGGKSLKVGDIGSFSVLRQNLIYPGEKITPSVTGNVRLSGLRQQTSVYLHASIEAFVAPLRWYWDDFTDYIQEGVTTAHTIPTLSGAWVADSALAQTQNLGIGSLRIEPFCKWFAQHPVNVFNEWYRWHEDARFSVTGPTLTFYNGHGQKCVNLSNASTRLHAQPVFDAQEDSVPSATVVKLQELAAWQARFSQAAKRNWNSGDTRYNVFMRDTFGAKGNNEVDKIPIKLTNGATLSVNPRDQYASDGPSLGELMSVQNFSVSHKWDSYRASEHMICCYVMVLRFLPIRENEVMPAVHPAQTAYAVYNGDPNLIENNPPQPVSELELEAFGSSSTAGYLPMGWQMREGYNHVDRHIATLNQFPFMSQPPYTAAGFRDATKINNATFRSTALRHWFADLDFKIKIDSPTPPAGTSIMAGSNESGGKLKGNHPTAGYLE